MYSANRTPLQWSLGWTLWLLGMPVAAHAQETPGIVWDAGASLAMVRTTHGGSTIDASMAERVPVLGLAAGVFARLELARWNGVLIGVQPELSYAPRGADVEIDGVYQGNLRSRYLEAPILVRLESPPLGPAAFYVVAGPAPGFLLSAESESGLGVVADVKAVTSKLDLGLAAGAGAVVTIVPRIALSVEARYTHGLATVDDTGEFEIENRALCLSVGVAARFGPRAPAARTQ